MDNRKAQKKIETVDFNLTINMKIHWFVKTTKSSIRFDNFLEALEFYNQQEIASIFPIEEICRAKT